MNLDLKSNLDVVQSLAPAARTSSANGAGVSLANFAGAMAVIDAGLWTDGSHTFEVQESDDDSDYAAVAAADLDGAEPVIDGNDDDAQVYRIGYRGIKAWLRVVVTVAGTTSGAVYGASIIRTGKRKLPV